MSECAFCCKEVDTYETNYAINITSIAHPDCVPEEKRKFWNCYPRRSKVYG